MVNLDNRVQNLNCETHPCNPDFSRPTEPTATDPILDSRRWAAAKYLSFGNTSVPPIARPDLALGQGGNLTNNPFLNWVYNDHATTLPYASIKPEDAMPAAQALLQDLEAQFSDYEDFLQRCRFRPLRWKEVHDPYAAISMRLTRFYYFVDLLQLIDLSLWEETSSAVCQYLDPFKSKLASSPTVYHAFAAFSDKELTEEQQRARLAVLKDAALYGVNLPADKFENVVRYEQELTKLLTDLNASEAQAKSQFKVELDSEAAVVGLDETLVAKLADDCNQKPSDDQTGRWCVTNLGTATAVLVNSPNPSTRAAVYAERWSYNQGNAPYFKDVIAIRAKQSANLGYPNYAFMATEGNFINTPRKFREFADPLWEKMMPDYREAYDEIRKLAAADGLDLSSENLLYYFTKWQKTNLQFDESQIRQKLELSRCLDVLFAKTEELFGVDIICLAEQAPGFPEGVRYYKMARDGRDLGYFYMDLGNRATKNRAYSYHYSVINAEKLPDGTRALAVSYMSFNFENEANKDGTLNLSLKELGYVCHEISHFFQAAFYAADSGLTAGTLGGERDATEVGSMLGENLLTSLVTEEILADDSELLAQYQKVKAEIELMKWVRQLALAKTDQAMFTDPQISDFEGVNAHFCGLMTQARGVCGESLLGFTHPFGEYAGRYYNYLVSQILSQQMLAAVADRRAQGADLREVGRLLEEGYYQYGGARPMSYRLNAVTGSPDLQIQPFLQSVGIEER